MCALSLSGVCSEATSFAEGIGSIVYPLMSPIMTNVYAMKLLYLKCNKKIHYFIKNNTNIKFKLF